MGGVLELGCGLDEVFVRESGVGGGVGSGGVKSKSKVSAMWTLGGVVLVAEDCGEDP